MQALLLFLVAAIIFGLCRAVDVFFSKKFRSKAQHMSGLAVRISKRYGVFGVILTALGVAAMVTGVGTAADKVLLYGGIIVAALGICLAVYYLSFGIFYDGETFLVSKFGKKSVVHRFGDIQSQKLYLIQGGGIVIELNMADGSTVSLQSSMDGVYPFLDAAFAAWCMQNGRDPQNCEFYDPSKSWWFPHEEEA